MAPDLMVRRARPQDAAAISQLNNTFANEGRMLKRSPEVIALARFAFTACRLRMLPLPGLRSNCWQ